MKRSPWFPLWAGFQDDEQFLSVSAEAELLYLRAVARCKLDGQGDAEGVVSRHQLRRLTDKLSTDPDELCRQLCEADPVPLWVALGDGRYQIRAYGAWVRSAEQYRQARAEHARRANHTRWKHEEPFESCRRCNVTPGESDRTPPGLPTESQTVTQDDTRQYPPLPPMGPSTEAAVSELAAAALADEAVQRATLDPTAVASRRTLDLVGEVLAAGHRPADVLDAGSETAEKGARDPEAYLRSILKRLAGEPPAPRPAVGPNPLANIAADVPVPPLPAPETTAAGLAAARAALQRRPA